MLRITDLRKDFHTVRAVDGVSFEVHAGEIFGLLGPNGAGKTTTIRMVLNILAPDAGSITYNGTPFTETVRNNVGYLPEERGLYRKSRVADTVVYFAQLRGMPADVARVQTGKWLHRFGMQEVAPRRVQELSKGNQQKIQFISAIIHDPPLVILDEPFSGLDPVNQILFKDIMQELKQRGKAIIFSTHQMDQAERLSDTLCLINRGRVVLAGTVRDVKKRYGKNSLHVEFHGDGSLLQHLPGVQRAILYENAAELELEQGVKVRELIGRMNEALELRAVELREPSLHSIFMQTVGGPTAAALPQAREEAGA